MPAPYLQSDVITALRGASRTWSFRYERLTQYGEVVGPLELRDVKVTHAALADKIKRNLTGSLSPDATFDFLSDRVRAYARLQMPDLGWHEWSVGTFLLTTSQTARRSSMPRVVVPVTGFDLLQVLVEDTLTDRYVVAAGANYVTAIATVLAGAGFPTNTIAATTKTLPAALEWAPGVSKLKVANDLLSAINYGSLSMDPLGNPTAAPYTAPGDAPVLWAYALDTASLVRPGTTTDLDLFSVPNVVIGYVSAPDRPTLRSVATNASADSPLSTVRRGRSIVRTLDSTEIGDVADQATLDAKVAQILAEASQQYETITFDTGLMPQHNDADVVTFDYGQGATRYRETGWELDMKAGGTMRHTARRAVSV